VAQRFTKKDVSTSLRNSESGMVDQVMVSTNVDGQRFVKVKVRIQLGQGVNGENISRSGWRSTHAAGGTLGGGEFFRCRSPTSSAG